MTEQPLLQRDWKSLRRAVKARWPKLTEDDLVAIDGDPAWLVDAVIARYGIERSVAEREWRSFAAHLGNGASDYSSLKLDARDALEPGAAKLREGFAELATGFAAIAREAGALGRARAGAAAGSAQEAARAKLAELGDVEGTLDRMGTFVRERPFTAMGIAFVAGWLLLGRK